MEELINDPAVTQEMTEGTEAAARKPASRKAAEKKLIKNNPTESEYSAADLAKAARARFGVPPEIVTAALRMVGKPKATFAEAQEIVKEFLAKEVK